MTPADLDLITAIADAAQTGRIHPGDVPRIARNSTATRTHWARSRADVLQLAAALRQARTANKKLQRELDDLTDDRAHFIGAMRHAIGERDRARDLAAGLEIDQAENCTCGWPF